MHGRLTQNSVAACRTGYYRHKRQRLPSFIGRMGDCYMVEGTPGSDGYREPGGYRRNAKNILSTPGLLVVERFKRA